MISLTSKGVRMKVWVVVEYRPRMTNESGAIYGLFSTKPKAKAYVNKHFGADYTVLWNGGKECDEFFLADEDFQPDVKEDECFGAVFSMAVDAKNPYHIHLG
jgi:hypothetical protein